MVVAAADFYRYAEATGTPLPESKKEEAQLAPAVNQWKKSRTSRNQNENNSNLGTAAAATAALAGIGATVLGLSRGKRPDTSLIEDTWSKVTDKFWPNRATSTAVGGLQKDLNNIELSVTPETPIAKKFVERETPTSQSQPEFETEFVNTLATEELWNNAYQKGIQEGLTDEQAVIKAKQTLGQKVPETYSPGPQSEIRKELADSVSSPLSYIQNKGYVQPPTAVDVAKLDDISVSQQAIENTNLNINAASNAGPQVGLDPEVTKVASSQLTQADINAINNDLGNKAAQVKALQQELLTGQRSNLGPKPITTQTRQDGFYTSPRRLSSEAKEYARTGDIGSFTGKAFGGSRLAGATNVPVQRGTPAGGQLQLPIVYSTQDKINPALRTQLVNEGPTYTSVDEYLKRFEPVKEEIIESPLAKEIARQDLIDNFYQTQREDQLIKAGLRPGTIKFENALASGWSSKPGINQRITNESFRENVVLPKEVEDYIATKIPETDASNIARDYYNPDTGNIQYPTVKGDAPITRDIYKERVIDNEDLEKAASGTSIRGESRSMDIQDPKFRTRTDEFTGDVRPDRIGGTLPTGGIPADLQASQLSKQEVVQSIINPSPVSREDLTGGGAGMGVYGRQLGYVPGPTSKTAGTRPTQLPEGKYGEWNPTTQRDEFRDNSNEALRKIIAQGTYRSGKSSGIAKEAQQELTLRQNLNYPENYTPTKQTTLDAMKVSDDIRRIYSSGRPDAQQQVDLYLKAQGAPQRTSTSFVVNEDVDLRGTPVKLGEQPVETSVTQTKVAQPLNYPAAQNQVTYVPPTESTIRSLSITPSEIEKAERMHLLNYISAAHGQIKGGAKAEGTKMRNNLTPYQAPSDAMINQLVMKRRMERL